MADVQPNQDNDERDDKEPVVGLAPRSFAVPGNDLTGYLGVAPEYQNYADPTNKPYMTEEEAYLYTNLDRDRVEATRDRTMPPGMELPENEKPAIAENTGGMGLFADDESDEDEQEGAEPEVQQSDEVQSGPDATPVEGPEVTRPSLSPSTDK